jgi:hypothetical protein
MGINDVSININSLRIVLLPEATLNEPPLYESLRKDHLPRQILVTVPNVGPAKSPERDGNSRDATALTSFTKLRRVLMKNAIETQSFRCSCS